jgi:hypothetical protein
MLRVIISTVALLLGAAPPQPAAAQSGAELVKQSIAAQGGADMLRNYKSAIIKVEAKHWEPGQSYSPTGEARFIGDSNITLTVDLANRMARVDWDRDLKYPLTEKQKYSEITAPRVDLGHLLKEVKCPELAAVPDHALPQDHDGRDQHE